MAKLTGIIGVTHNPILHRRMQREHEHAGIHRIRDGFAEMRAALAAQRPDLLLVVANDHLCQWFMDIMPAFIVGRSPRAAGPFKHEEALFGVPHYEAEVHVEAATEIIRRGFEVGVDFAYSDEFTMDHAFTMPLCHIRPEADIPIVPIFTNVMAPPVAPARRFFQVGEALDAIVADLPRDLRVAVLSSGHLSLEIGGPKQAKGGSPDPEFDRMAVQAIAAADGEALIREATWNRMVAAGNASGGLLNFVLLTGLARGRKPVRADYVASDTSSAPFLVWDFEGGGGR